MHANDFVEEEKKGEVKVFTVDPRKYTGAVAMEIHQDLAIAALGFFGKVDPEKWGVVAHGIVDDLQTYLDQLF